jgi:type IV fimbrial biogenesis protein FimT
MSRQKGLTLVELMVTLAVAIILVAVGMPLFNSVAANNRASAHTNMLVTALNLARSEAVGRAETVTLCSSSSNPPGATPTCGDATQWGNGWFAFTDAGTLGTVDGSDERLRIWETPSGSLPTVAVTGSPFVTFNYLGSASALSTFELSQSGASGNPTRCVTLSATGQIRTVRAACP